MIVRRGFQRARSLHDEKVRTAKVGHLYDVIRIGLGAMPAYARQVPVRDRWAIVAYVRALQLSRHAALADLSETDRNKLPPGQPDRGTANDKPANDKPANKGAAP